MKRLSLFQIILLVVFGSLAVVGVLVFAIAVGGGKTNTIGPITIWGTIDEVAFMTSVKSAAENAAELEDVTYTKKDPTTYESELTEALARGVGPDLFVLRQDYAIKNAGKVLTIPFSVFSQANFESTFIEASKSFLTKDGFVAVPVLADPLVLFVNKDILATAGFVEPPKYWDELFNMSKKITQRDDAGSITQSTIAMGEYQNVPFAKDILATLILQVGGSITYRDQSGNLAPSLSARGGNNSEGAITALRFYTEFADPSKDDYSWNRALPDAQKAFAAGDLALYIGYASEVSTIARTNPNLNYAIAPLPQLRSNRGAQTLARVYGLAVSRTGKNPQGAVTAAFLLANTANSSVLSRATGLSPVRADVLKASEPQKTSAASLLSDGVCKGLDTVVCSTIFARFWFDPDPEKTGEIFRAMIENTISGALQLRDAIQRADQEMGELVKP